MSDEEEIPPPLIPNLPNLEPDKMFLPYMLADAPRLQLDFLSRNVMVPEMQRKAIKSWLYGYNIRMARWIHSAYGPEGVRAADALSRATANKMNEYIKEYQDRAERDLFGRLAEEMGDEDE